MHVDIAFWGGLVKGNTQELEQMVKAGVVGFKCFMCPSGVDEFPHVDAGDIRDALKALRQSDTVLAVTGRNVNCKSVFYFFSSSSFMRK